MTKTVLVVEDDDIIRGSIARAVQDKGLTAIEAANGKEALEKVAGVDIVVTDIRMPQMDGLELVTALRDDNKTKHLPIIILTGDEKTTVMNEALAAGVTTYLSKSTTDAEEISKQIVTALG